MLPVEDWAEIRRLHRVEGLSQRAIASRLGIARVTVARALRRDQPPRYRRAPRPSKLDPFKARIAELLREYPTLSSVRLGELLAPEGYTGKGSILRAYVRTQRPRPVVYRRTVYRPGEIGQVDWAELPDRVPDAFGEWRKLYVLLLVLGYSRVLTAGFSFGTTLPDLLRCLSECLAWVGGVPRTLVFDNMKAVVLRHRGPEVVWNPQFLLFAERYGFRPHACTPGPTGAHEKGLVERPIRYLKGNFWAGRRFTGLADVQAQFEHWRDGVANVRRHATLHERPLDRLGAERAALLPLPAQPYGGWEVRFARVTRQGLVRVETNDYSVPAVLVGQPVEVHLGAATVRVLAEGALVAEHARSHGRHRLVQDPAHRTAPWRATAAPPPPPSSRLLLPPHAQVAVQLPDLRRYEALLESAP
jgi:transposase